MCAFNLLMLKVLCRAQGVGSVLSLCSTCLNHGTLLMHSLAVLSHLWARFAYIFAHYGHERSRRRAPARRGEAPLYYYKPMCLFFDICTLFLSAPGSFLVHSAAGHAGSPPVHHGASLQVWVPGGLRGAYSGHSKSRKLASNHGVAFREGRAEQDNSKLTCQLFCSTAVKGSNTVATIA